MAKKLILLILVLPLVLMLVLFSATKTVSRNIDVAVSGLEYIGDNPVFLDLDKDETYTVEYAIYPTSAKNKSVTYSIAAVDDKKLCTVDMDKLNETNVIVPLTPGSAMVTITTNDGGLQKSFRLEVFSGAIESIESTIENDKLLVGETTKIKNTFTPENATNILVKYVSDNEKVATVNQFGVVKAVGKGTCTITIISEANEYITDTVTLNVENEGTMDLTDSEIPIMNTSGEFGISLDIDESFIEGVDYSLSFEFYEGTKQVGPEIISGGFIGEGSNRRFKFKFTESDYIGDIRCVITFTSDYETLVKECVISKIKNISLEFYEEGAFGVAEGQMTTLPFKITPADTDARYTVTATGDAVTAIFMSGNLLITGEKVGVSTVTLTAVDRDFTEATASVSIDVVVTPKVLMLPQTADSYGIEGLLTIGKYDADGNVSSPFKLIYQSNDQLPEDFTKHIKWHSSADEISVDGDGGIIFNDDTYSGVVDFYAEFSYGGVTMRTEKHSIRCVADGVNVNNYKDLLTATRAGKKVVLRASIKDDFGYENGKPVYEEIISTYDTTYYENANDLDSAKVKILIQFKNDVYGNGYEINAHNVTYGLDSAGKLEENALFKGPLHFVAMTEPKSETLAGGMVSVKGQDNIAFAVYENVTLSNVVLKSCDLIADEDGKYDLVDLNFVGTTVEVLGDNVSIEYSRIANGRTVVRAFGDVNDSSKVINLNIQNTVLSTAREFILRMGSNCFVDGTNENPSPYLEGDSEATDDHMAKKVYDSFTDEEKRAYDEKYIKTFVTVKDSVFRDAGIFAVGIDSHFSGAALANGKAYENILGPLITHWQGLAKTSYGAKLTFTGDVRVYNWKELSEVDSSTLIEINGESKYAELLEFEVGALVDGVSQKENFENIIYSKNGVKYVHGGVAFFGGGKNYGVFELKDYTWEGYYDYEIAFGDIGKHPLAAAAGNENFYFFLHDATSLGFLPEDQERYLNSGNGYSNIFPKK